MGSIGAATSAAFKTIVVLAIEQKACVSCVTYAMANGRNDADNALLSNAAPAVVLSPTAESGSGSRRARERGKLETAGRLRTPGAKVVKVTRIRNMIGEETPRESILGFVELRCGREEKRGREVEQKRRDEERKGEEERERARKRERKTENGGEG